MWKSLWRGIKKYIKEIILVLVGLVAGIVLSHKKKEEDILSEVGNAIDTIEANSQEKADEFKRKLEVIKGIQDRSKRMEELLRLWKELDED